MRIGPASARVQGGAGPRTQTDHINRAATWPLRAGAWAGSRRTMR